MAEDARYMPLKQKKIVLSERLMKIAAHIRCEDKIADVGTDHGYLPIWLSQNHAAAGIIVSDINEGPLQKAAGHIARYCGPGDQDIELRLGGGLSVLRPGEADVIVIAGMGGILIRRILSEAQDVVNSARRLILQPRNHTFTLREYLHSMDNFTITDEEIAREGSRLSEIITATRDDCLKPEQIRRIRRAENLERELALDRELYSEVPVMLLIPRNREMAEEAAGRIDTVNMDFLEKKCRSERIVIDNIRRNGRSDYADARLARAQGRLDAFERMMAAVSGSDPSGIN